MTDLKEMKPGHLYIQYLYSNSNKGQVGGEAGPLYYSDKVACTDLWVHYSWQWRITIIHELAHIAVNRWWSWKTNHALMNYWAGKRIKHDKIFHKAEHTLYKRAIKAEGSPQSLKTYLINNPTMPSILHRLGKETIRE